MGDDDRYGVIRRLRERQDGVPFLAVVAFGWFLTLGMRFVVPALLPQVKATFRIDNTGVGVAVSVIWASYALTQFPAGVLINRTGERTLLAGSLLVAGLGVGSLGLSPVMPVFLVSCALFGFGTGLYGPPRGTALSNAFPGQQGTVFGVTLAAGSVGSAALPFLANKLLVWGGWRGVLGLAVPLFLAAAVLVWLVVPMRAVTARGGADSLEAGGRDVLAAIGNRSVLAATAGITLAVFTFQGLTAFLPLYLVETKGLDQTEASTVYAAFFVSGAVAQLGVGAVVDKVGDRPVLVVLAVVGTATLVALPFVHGLAPLIALAVVLGSRVAFAPVTNAYIIRTLPDEVQGTAWGSIRTGLFVVAASGSSVVGAFADRGLFDEAFLALAAVTAVAGLCYAVLPATRDPGR
jgi:MFS family permease